MNQRLIVILAITLVFAGVIGILFSESDSTTSDQQVLKEVKYFVTKRAMAAGERITENDVQEDVEKVAENEIALDNPAAVVGWYLNESIVKGTRITHKLLTDERPVDNMLGQSMFRFTVPLDNRYANNLLGIIPGDKVDVYARFSAPKREFDNKSVIFRGESVVKIVKLFRDKKVLSPLMKGDQAAVEEEEEKKTLFSNGKLLNSNADFTIDIELSRADLKKVYQVDNDFELILFPTEQPITLNSKRPVQVNNLDKGGKK